MVTERRSRKKIIILLILILAAALIFAAVRFYMSGQGTERSDDTLEQMEKIIPGLYADTDISTGTGRDPLAALSVDGLDIVGCLQIPSLDLTVPVTGKKMDEKGFATWVSGSPVKGRFRISGNHADVYRDLSSADPGDRVIFTDIDGVKYVYKVTTQYHLKKWDKADNDLILCYKTDDDTDFVLGCTSVI